MAGDSRLVHKKSASCSAGSLFFSPTNWQLMPTKITFFFVSPIAGLLAQQEMDMGHRLEPGDVGRAAAKIDR